MSSVVWVVTFIILFREVVDIQSLPPPRLSASSTTDETPKSISDSAVGNTVRHRLSVVGWFCIPGLQYRQDTVCRFAARTPLKQSCKFKRYRATQKLTAKRRPWKTKLLQPTA